MTRAVFLDRDGVINKNWDTGTRALEKFIYEDGALSALAKLAIIREPIIVVTNQAAVGRGLMSRETLQQIHDKMLSDIKAAGGRVDAIYICPHKPEDRCQCRKPLPGLLTQAAAERHLSLQESFVLGDYPRDLASGLAVGATTIWLDHRYTFHLEWGNTRPHHTVTTLEAAVELILQAWGYR